MEEAEKQTPKSMWNAFFQKKAGVVREHRDDGKLKWNMGMLNDRETIEVPGSVLLLAQGRNEPLGLRNAPARTSHSSLPTGLPHPHPQDTPSEPIAEPIDREHDEKKKTKDGQIILEPQPDDSHNDPLNWPAWRRDIALLSLGLYCAVGGGITPIIAAGFTDVANDYHIDVSKVSLTTGLYMMGLGIGSVIFSPTAILYGKRPVYLYSVILFILSAVWCALSPNFTSLILARIFQGIAVSPVECLPSATIAEIFFLHERAYRIGVYTLLLLGGKNLVPLLSAAIIERLEWRWVFWIVAIVVGFCGTLLFFFVPETFWDRSPIPRSRRPKRPSLFSRRSSARQVSQSHLKEGAIINREKSTINTGEGNYAESHHEPTASLQPRNKGVHVGFAPGPSGDLAPSAEHVHDTPIIPSAEKEPATQPSIGDESGTAKEPSSTRPMMKADAIARIPRPNVSRSQSNSSAWSRANLGGPGRLTPQTPQLHMPNSPPYEHPSGDYFRAREGHTHSVAHGAVHSDTESEKMSFSNLATITRGQAYTHALRNAPPKSFAQQLKVHHGRLNQDRWWKAAIRPFILFSYPSVLWSAAVYACSIGWLIVISESVAVIYREGRYQFNALQTGLVYISPFIGGVLGTAVAGKVSDVIVRAMARRNGGLYEPEFRLVMAIPVAVTTVIGLMGFGWSADVDDPWIAPTVFFGVVSFGCALGSTTSITFCVDSYRQYAGEALVTLNFSKNIFHGLVFSIFVTEWLTDDGSKMVFLWLGIIQLILLLFTIPMYIFGKRARMWTVRKNFMEKF
ncbi:MFS general substrate transporter [Annulohypoxylon truncatum]|uniref:MFS general substrate transporter n=1 Tax=Annulohypoxylon truncatum TaxID=327061 RepID=UPI002008CBC5|nr:MFS general substrate transporter [Annulohypoxylon truncatum]KAI1212845.1 MFS general substrate transporter [Annulohypoxylon truncatum]